MPEQKKPTSNGLSERIWDMATKAAVPLSLLIGGAMVAHEIRITKLEETRFTTIDAERMRREIESSYPPPWLRAQILEMKASLAEINTRLRDLEREK